MHSTGEKELYDFWPLPGDPSPEERAELMKQAKVDEQVNNDSYARSVLNDYKSKGIA